MPEFVYRESNGIGYYMIEEFDKAYGVKTCFSTRDGGVSSGPYSALNFGLKSGDERDNVYRNFEILCRAAGINMGSLVLSDQVHGSTFRIVTRDDMGKGLLRESDINSVDSLITDQKGIALCIFTADCVPVFLLDMVKGVVSLCHAGWRGIINGIVPKTIKAMTANYGSKPADILCGIAPSIGPCCFEVGHEVADIFNREFESLNDIVFCEGGHYKIDLWNAVVRQLETCGLNTSNIVSSRMCTSCNEDKFYSYRRDGAKTGRMVSIIQLL
jgi:uncharacterized protein, YfiH family